MTDDAVVVTLRLTRREARAIISWRDSFELGYVFDPELRAMYAACTERATTLQVAAAIDAEMLRRAGWARQELSELSIG